jgi:PIN domain nuclease of toxin-antitoxin system
VSLASCWELAIKQSTGKLALPAPASEYLPARLDLLAASLLPITAEHVYTAAALPYHHRDPFDRLLIAQSMVEQLPVVTADARFAAYGIELLPA